MRSTFHEDSHLSASTSHALCSGVGGTHRLRKSFEANLSRMKLLYSFCAHFSLVFILAYDSNSIEIFFLPSSNLNEAYRVKCSPFHNFIRSCFLYYLIIYIFCVRCSIHCSRPCAREPAYPNGDNNLKHMVALLSATTNDMESTLETILSHCRTYVLGRECHRVALILKMVQQNCNKHSTTVEGRSFYFIFYFPLNIECVVPSVGIASTYFVNRDEILSFLKWICYCIFAYILKYSLADDSGE